MAQAGQNLALAAKTIESARIEPAAFDHFNSDDLRQLAIGAFGFVNGAHSAAAQQIGGDEGAETLVQTGDRQASRINDSAQSRFRSLVVIEQSLQLLSQLRRECAEQLRALRRR
jgi:hypothetical protein